MLTAQNKEKIIFDAAIRLGEYFANIAGTWHEILTWYGYKSKILFSEFPSAFSWEDTYSNMLGCDIGAKALRDTKNAYEKAVEFEVDDMIDDLGGQSAELAKYAAEKMRGIWFTGRIPPFVDMKKRNFDIGLGSGFVTPILVDSINICDGAIARSHPVPNLEFLADYGFSMELQIDPKVWEEDKIFKVVYQDNKTEHKYIEPDKHFPQIMSEIQQTQKMLLSAQNYKPAPRRLYN